MKTVLVTGCGRGIGFATAQKFLSMNFEVLGTYRTKSIELETLEKSSNGKLKLFQVDFSKKDQLNSFVKTIEKQNINVLVNNAGMAQRKPFLELTAEDWTEMFNVNFFSITQICKAVLPGMIERRTGRIVNISSVGGQWGGVFQIHYAASKSAIINLTKSLAKSFSQNNITVNCISPGSISTEMIQPELPKDAQGMENFLQGIPAKRIGTPEEVAELVYFLSSPAAGYITGQTININGGIFLG